MPDWIYAGSMPDAWMDARRVDRGVESGAEAVDSSLTGDVSKSRVLSYL